MTPIPKCKIYPDKIKDEFLKQVEDIWQNGNDFVNLVNDKTIDFDTVIFDKEPYATKWASIMHTYSSRKNAIGDTILRFPTVVTLNIGPEFKNLDTQQCIDVLRHEAAHLGYNGHGKDFERFAQVKKFHVSSVGVLGKDIELQHQSAPGKRYKTIASFKDVESLRAYYNENCKGKIPGSYRMLR